MQRTRGFSLTEILISLFLIMSISLALLKQQWQMNQLLHNILKRFEILTQLDNNRDLIVKRSTQRGFSLIESFISLLLVSLIMGGLIKQYLQVKQQYQRLQTVIDNANDIQLVSEFMRDSLHKAGFTPCLMINQLETLDDRNTNLSLKALSANGDVLNIYRMDNNFLEALSILNRQDIKLHSSVNFQVGRPVIIADCYHAEVQEISNLASGNLISLSRPLVFNYIPPVYVGHWIEESFFIKNNHHHKPSLFYKERHTEELTSLVQEMVVKSYSDAGYILVEIALGLNNGKKHIIIEKSLVRGT